MPFPCDQSGFWVDRNNKGERKRSGMKKRSVTKNKTGFCSGRCRWLPIKVLSLISFQLHNGDLSTYTSGLLVAAAARARAGSVCSTINYCADS